MGLVTDGPGSSTFQRAHQFDTYLIFVEYNVTPPRRESLTTNEPGRRYYSFIPGVSEDKLLPGPNSALTIINFVV